MGEVSVPAPDVFCPPCEPCAASPCPETSPGPPGPQGPAGANGAAGANGIDAISITSAGFTVPNVGFSVAISADETTWMVVGQNVYVGNAGYYQVVSQSGMGAQLMNLGSAGNASPGTVVAAGQTISPAGPPGAVGGGTVTSVQVAVPSWLAATGGPVTGSGTITIAAAAAQTQDLVLATPDGAPGAVALIALTPGHIPAIPASKLNTAVAIAGGGTGQTTKTPAFNALAPTTTKGDVIASDGTNNVRVPVGTNGQVLTAQSGATSGVAWQTPAVPLVSVLRLATATPDIMQATDLIIGLNVATAASETLVAAPANARMVTIKDESGAASSNHITINAGAGDTIQGGPTDTITTNYGYRTYYYRATSKVWNTIASA